MTTNGDLSSRPEPVRSARLSHAFIRLRPGILADGAVARAIGAPLAVGLAGLLSLTAATVFAMSWTHLRARLS